MEFPVVHCDVDSQSAAGKTNESLDRVDLRRADDAGRDPSGDGSQPLLRNSDAQPDFKLTNVV